MALGGADSVMPVYKLGILYSYTKVQAGLAILWIFNLPLSRKNVKNWFSILGGLVAKKGNDLIATKSQKQKRICSSYLPFYSSCHVGKKRE